MNWRTPFATAWVVFVVLLASTGAAQGDAPLASVSVAGSTTFDGSIVARGELLGGVWTAMLNTTVRLSAPVVHGVLYTANDTNLALIQPEDKSYGDEFVLHNVTLLTEPRQEGWMGFEEAGHATFSLLPEQHLGVDPIGHQMATASATSPKDYAPDHPNFQLDVPGPHQGLAMAGVLSGRVGGTLKLQGPTLVVTSNEGIRRIETGYDPEATPLQQYHRWVVLDFPEGVLEIHTRDDPTLAVGDLTVAWTGLVAMEGAKGTVQTPQGVRTVANEPLRISGEGTTTLEAVLENGAPVNHASITGTLAGTGIPLAKPRLEIAWWVFPVFLAAVALGLGGIRLYRRLHPPVTMDECVDMANAALAGGRHAVALEWIERALVLGPETARLRMEQGDCLAALGDVAAALKAYERAAELTEDGEPLYMAALLADAVDEGPDAVERFLVRALERTPLFALDLEDDFPRLRTRRSFRAMLAQARGRIG